MVDFPTPEEPKNAAVFPSLRQAFILSIFVSFKALTAIISAPAAIFSTSLTF